MFNTQRGDHNNLFPHLNQSILVGLKPPKTFQPLLKSRPNDRNMPTQHIATSLGATCCVRLATALRCVAVLGVVGSSLTSFKLVPSTSSMSQHVATQRNKVAKRTHVGMLRSFGLGFYIKPKLLIESIFFSFSF